MAANLPTWCQTATNDGAPFKMRSHLLCSKCKIKDVEMSSIFLVISANSNSQRLSFSSKNGN